MKLKQIHLSIYIYIYTLISISIFISSDSASSFFPLIKLREIYTSSAQSLQEIIQGESLKWLPALSETFDRWQAGPGGNLPMQGGALGFGLGFSKQDDSGKFSWESKVERRIFPA